MIALGRCLGRRTLLFAALLLLAVTIAASEQQSAAEKSGEKKREEEGLPLKPERTVRFTTDEGTWISLDVSPDGKTILFELLGDLYTLPIAGGRATRITDGPAFDSQPRYSPDGKQIVFVSDRDGWENLWIASADGKNARALTKGKENSFISPVWTPDGRGVVVSSSTMKEGTTLMFYDVAGGSGLRIDAAPSSAPGTPPGPPPRARLLGAAFAKNPRYVYVSQARPGGYGFGIWTIAVLDRESGKVTPIISAAGSAMRPALSPDGNYLVYATRRDAQTALKLRDLGTGDETLLVPVATRDDQEGSPSRDLMPGSAFTPDSKTFVTSYSGKIWRVAIPSGEATPIPFTADVEQQLGRLVKFDYTIDDSTVTVRQIRDARRSPDGKHLAFSALDRLWIMDMPAGTPRRVTEQAVGEFSPAWSPDGQFLSYVTWSSTEAGHIYRVRADGRSQPERLTKRAAWYDRLTYMPDGARLVFTRGSGQQRLEWPDQMEGPSAMGVELMWMPASGGEATLIAPVTQWAAHQTFYGVPHFTSDKDRVFITDAQDGLISMRLDGTDRRGVVKIDAENPSAPIEEIMIAPHGDRVIALVNEHVYLISLPMAGSAPLKLTDKQLVSDGPVPIRRANPIGGAFIGWDPDGRSFHYSIGASYFTYDLEKGDTAEREAQLKSDPEDKKKEGAATKPAYSPERVDLLITVPRDKPSGTLVLHGARVITMKGTGTDTGVIDKGDIVITDNRIAAVGRSGSVRMPAGAKVIDATGKTIMPGLVDIHAHMRPAWGVHRTQVPEFLANLAYGVTTTRDPQTSSHDVVTYGDVVDTGAMLGPRIFSTSRGVFSADDIKSRDQARDVLRRYSEFYKTMTIKQYAAGKRTVRQWIIMAAQDQKLMPTTEGALDFKMNLTEMLDGYPGHEHSYPIFPLYKDTVQLAAQSGITYTPTLLVSYGGPQGEDYYFERVDIHDDPKLRRFLPHAKIDRVALRRNRWVREDQFVFKGEAEQAAKIVAAGGRVGLGGHGELQGLGTHWELWEIASGGMPVRDVLRVATVFGAEAIGLGKQLGSLEVGKLADLNVLDKNPLDDLHNTTALRYVMKNGRLYEADTLNEIWPRQKPLERQWWWESETRTSPSVATGRK